MYDECPKDVENWRRTFKNFENFTTVSMVLQRESEFCIKCKNTIDMNVVELSKMFRFIRTDLLQISFKYT